MALTSADGADSAVPPPWFPVAPATSTDLFECIGSSLPLVRSDLLRTSRTILRSVLLRKLQDAGHGRLQTAASPTAEVARNDETLLRAARRVFARDGVHASVNAIAEAAGLVLGTRRVNAIAEAAGLVLGTRRVNASRPRRPRHRPRRLRGG
nr:TetR family transcriptional regulator [Microtetraspora malaysiensis]